jgi:hypothetical protein
MKLFPQLLLVHLTMSIAMPAVAALNDIFPNDFYALSAGRGTATTYIYERQQVGPYVKGRQVGDLQGNSTIAALRLSRYYTVGGWKLAPVLVLSAAHLQVAGASVPASVDKHRSGLGDLRLGGTAWIIDNPQDRHFLGLNLMTVWPTGDYDKQELANPSENRRRQALTLGWIKGLTENLTLDLSPEIAWYGTNKESFPGSVEVKQGTTLSLTGYLRYRFSPQWHAFIGGQFNEGGETRVNGVDQDNTIRGQRVFLGGSYVFDPGNILNLRWASDNSVTTGLKTENELTLRWVHGF